MGDFPDNHPYTPCIHTAFATRAVSSRRPVDAYARVDLSILHAAVGVAGVARIRAATLSDMGTARTNDIILNRRSDTRHGVILQINYEDTYNQRSESQSARHTRT